MSQKQEQAKKAREAVESAKKQADFLAASKASDEQIAAAQADLAADMAAADQADADADAEARAAEAVPTAPAEEEGWFRVVTGYNLHHPYQNVLLRTGEATKLKVDDWVKAQLEAKIVVTSYEPS